MSCSLVSAHASVDRAWRFTQTVSDPASRTTAASVSSAQGSQRRQPRATDDVLSKSSATATWSPFESSAAYPGDGLEHILDQDTASAGAPLPPPGRCPRRIARDRVNRQ